MILEYVAIRQNPPGDVVDVAAVVGPICRVRDGQYLNPTTHQWTMFQANIPYIKIGGVWRYDFIDATPGEWYRVVAGPPAPYPVGQPYCYQWDRVVQCPAEPLDTNRVNTASISLYRSVRISDGAGGYTKTEVEIEGSPFAGRTLRRTKPLLINGVPGNAVQEQIVLVFSALTDVRVGDRALIGNVSYTVQTVRPYSRSVQADVEAIR